MGDVNTVGQVGFVDTSGTSNVSEADQVAAVYPSVYGEDEDDD